VLFRDEAGKYSEAQIEAFEDTWHWTDETERTYRELVTESSTRVSELMAALRSMVGTSEMGAYLVMMAARLVELHRVLKPTGSLYLHCDPTASHYLKILLDAIFGPPNYRNEIVWRRTPFAGSSKARARQFPRSHDVLLFYTKSDSYSFNHIIRGYDDDYYTRFKNPDNDPRGAYQSVLLKTFSAETFERLRSDNSLIPPKREGSGWRYKQFLTDLKGRQQDDIWSDINAINPTARERLGYPTQKPLALLERIIQASSNPGDVVLDPFCGCGTALVAAQKHGRRWAGIDVTHLSIALMKYRLCHAFPDVQFQVVGEPKDLASARQLALDDRFQFQWWALSLVKARPLGGESGSKTGKKGADRGIDGLISFFDDASNKPKRVMVQVKSGHVKSGDIRDLRGTVEREDAAIGVFITLEEPTREMTREAVVAGQYHSPGWQQEYPRIQILTIEQLLHDAEIKMPPPHETFRQAQRVRVSDAEQVQLDLGAS
jgi:site-specific DNA-methyltransferase (adenine-specific)